MGSVFSSAALCEKETFSAPPAVVGGGGGRNFSLMTEAVRCSMGPRNKGLLSRAALFPSVEELWNVETDLDLGQVCAPCSLETLNVVEAGPEDLRTGAGL